MTVRVERPLWAGLLVLSTLVYSGDAPPPTLPRAFVAQLPLLMDMPDEEFEGLLRYAQSTPVEAGRPAADRGRHERKEEDRHAP